MTTDEREALNELVPPNTQTGDLRTDLLAAVQETWRRRERNTELGATVLRALHRDTNSWRTVEYLTGIPHVTARRWATPPAQADTQEQPPAAPPGRASDPAAAEDPSPEHGEG